MRWRVLTQEEKWDIVCRWHKWFAWYPVRIIDPETGHTMKTWLETVGRKKTLYTYVYETKTGHPIYCFAEDLVFKALQDNDIIDNRDRR